MCLAKFFVHSFVVSMKPHRRKHLFFSHIDLFHRSCYVSVAVDTRLQCCQNTRVIMYHTNWGAFRNQAILICFSKAVVTSRNNRHQGYGVRWTDAGHCPCCSNDTLRIQSFFNPSKPSHGFLGRKIPRLIYDVFITGTYKSDCDELHLTSP
jgi:hypothetical protein